MPRNAPIPRKKCSSCERNLPTTEFTLRKDRGTPERPSFLSKCKKCQRSYMKHFMRMRRQVAKA